MPSAVPYGQPAGRYSTIPQCRYSSFDYATRSELLSESVPESKVAMGVDEIVFLGREDGALVDDVELRRDLVRLIRQWRPRRVVSGDPTFRYSPDGYINHPDHVAVASAASVAVYPFARNRPTFPDLLA